MKKEIPTIILTLVSLFLLVWTIRLNLSLRKLKEENKRLEVKLGQVLKERDFLKMKTEELERRLEEEKKASSLLTERFEFSQSKIKELEKELANLTKEITSLKKERETFEIEPSQESISLPREIAPIEEISPMEEFPSSF